MLWVAITIPFLLILLYLKVDNLADNLKINEAISPNEKIIDIEDRQALTQILKENTGNIVTIQSKNFTGIYDNRLIEDERKITGRILEVDEDWLNIEFDSRQFIKRNSLDHLIFRIDRINSFYINGDSNS